MTCYEINKFRRLIDQLSVPDNRTVPTQANLRWLLANAWIENRSNPKLYDLMRLIRPFA
ncbi:hypothetical protein MNBD_GAMMA22-2605 [hydrothermal vent metagenome]|uniref:Uncharacterized protein n=1 Tax=hydrothermal vent metagenome TaxID=652676 RepID=A0A3B0ZHB0_9ZZZZ